MVSLQCWYLKGQPDLKENDWVTFFLGVFESSALHVALLYMLHVKSNTAYLPCPSQVFSLFASVGPENFYLYSLLVLF